MSITLRPYRSGSTSNHFTLKGFIGFLALLWPILALPQTVLVYDGLTGIHDVDFRKDTAFITTLIPGSPADKAGVMLGDQVIAINDSAVAGEGLNKRALRRLLQDYSGKPIHLNIKRPGEAQLLTFSFRRDPYLYQIDSYDYTYLVDSLEQWDIRDVMSPSLDTLFKLPLDAKITVYDVEEGSPAENNGILAGDQIISLADEVDEDFSYHISYKSLDKITPDTSVAILRDEDFIYFFLLEPSLQGDLKGIKSQFEEDFSASCVWLKITVDSRLASDRTYLFNVPELKGKDFMNFYYTSPSGEVEEKKSGILIPVQERDFVYKDWHAVKVPLNEGGQQTFYLRLKAEESLGGPHLQIYAHETIVNYDRYERMVLFGFLVTMLIISAIFLVLFALVRARQYLFFALYVGSLVVFLFITDGYLDEYFWKENNFFLKFLEKFQPYIMSWISIFFLLFGIAYLELRKILKYWYRSVVIILSLTGIRIVMVVFEVVFGLASPAFVEDIFKVVWIFTVGIIPLFILIPPAILRIKSGFRPAWYFLIANLVLIPLIYITLYSSIFSTTVITITETVFSRLFITSGMYMAAILQVLIFSFGIARKIRLDEIQKKQIQEQIIEQLKVNEKLKDKVNLELEQKVKERTREISNQKEKIEIQRDLLFDQKKEILDSIDYAHRIQDAVLPSKAYLDRIMPEYFVLYQPKDVVSGDFYWIREVNNSLIIVSADCTGHGVPGAFMSMLGITLLDELLGKEQLDLPGEILNNLRSKVKEMLFQQGHEEEQKDGMDMAMIILDKERRNLQFAGAHNPLILIRDSKLNAGLESGLQVSMEGNGCHLFVIKGDRQPIGVHWEETEFTSHSIQLHDQDTLYVFTDGFVDQFGGEYRKKFKSQRFKELLLSVQSETMETQKKLLGKTFESWRGSVEQIDDVCVIGVRIRTES